MTPPISDPWTHRWAVIDGIRLHYVEAGSGPLVLLLHGFPDFWFTWRKQIPVLARAGFRVLAPDLRGYNESDKPPGIDNYRIERIVGDLLGLITHIGESQAHVVGHDWGGGIAWTLAMSHPSVVDQLAILNAPHPALFLRELRRPAQLLRSWYMFFFQLPFLPEWWLSLGNFVLIEPVWRKPPPPALPFTEDEIRQYKKALARPGALTAALNYYRAAFRRFGTLAQNIRPISRPTLVLWGERDPYVGLHVLQGLEEWVVNPRIQTFPEAGHWVQTDAPSQVNEALLAFLGGDDQANRFSMNTHKG